jgi:hypothetical protein
MAKVIRKPYAYWLKKITGRDFQRDYTPISRSLGVSPIDPIADLAARAFDAHGRCSERGWFGGHCSHTATLNPTTGRYETAEQSRLPL